MGIVRAPSTKRIKQLIKVAQSMGVKRLRVGEVEFELYPQSVINKSVDKTDTAIDSKSERIPTADELLFHSSPFLEDVQLEIGANKLPSV